MARKLFRNRRSRLVIETLESRVVPATDVLSYRGDITSIGVNAAETRADPR